MSYDINSALPIAIRSDDRIAWLVAFCKAATVQTEQLRNAVIMVAQFIISNEAFDKTCNIRDELFDIPESSVLSEEQKKQLKSSIKRDDLQNGLMLLCATKVTYYQTNHHVG